LLGGICFQVANLLDRFSGRNPGRCPVASKSTRFTPTSLDRIWKRLAEIIGNWRDLVVDFSRKGLAE